jgi:hypothetical protein
VNLGHDHRKLNCLNFKPLLPKTPVPKLAPKAKLFHVKLPVRVSFKIQFKQRENCKLFVSAFSLDETNTNHPSAPDDATRVRLDSVSTRSPILGRFCRCGHLAREFAGKTKFRSPDQTSSNETDRMQ